MEHNKEGTIGLVLNRPSPLTVLETVPEWRELVSPPDVVFVGGPVMPNNVVALGRVSATPHAGWSELPHGLGAVDLNADPADLGAALIALRLFAGYSGWGPSQLMDEVRDGAWWVFPVDPRIASARTPTSCGTPSSIANLGRGGLTARSTKRSARTSGRPRLLTGVADCGTSARAGRRAVRAVAGLAKSVRSMRRPSSRRGRLWQPWRWTCGAAQRTGGRCLRRR